MKAIATIWIVVALILTGCNSRSITPEQASKHIGDKVTVCGKVAGINFRTHARGNPTFINLDKPYPNHIFTIVIWGKDIKKFMPILEKVTVNSKLCVTGTIEEYRGKPQTIVEEINQLKTY